MMLFGSLEPGKTDETEPETPQGVFILLKGEGEVTGCKPIY